LAAYKARKISKNNDERVFEEKSVAELYRTAIDLAAGRL